DRTASSRRVRPGPAAGLDHEANQRLVAAVAELVEPGARGDHRSHLRIGERLVHLLVELGRGDPDELVPLDLAFLLEQGGTLRAATCRDRAVDASPPASRRSGSKAAT